MYRYKLLPHFKKQVNKLQKKYKNIIFDCIFELKRFKKDKVVALGRSVYKIRVKSSDLNKGKSGGFRLIVVLVEIDNIIIPISIYFKGDKDSISVADVSKHLAVISNENKN